MLSRLLQKLEGSFPGVYRQFKKPVIPILLLSMCGVTAYLRYYFTGRMANHANRRRISDDQSKNEASPKRGKMTRAAVGDMALDELSKFKSLKDFSYAFNEEGELRHIDTGARFEFKVKENHSYNQKRYEMIGEMITDEIYKLLETEGKLKRLTVPLDVADDEPASFIFVSDDYKTNKDKLLVLIHGSGVVRAGQWARRLIINNNLECGTQLPYITRAQKEGYAVIVLNSNLNTVKLESGEKKGIRLNGNPEQHGIYVWENIIRDLPAKNIAIVAHSYGGVATVAMANQFADEFSDRVFAIAFTDSVHSLAWQQAPDKVYDVFEKRGRNWVTSTDPIDTEVRSTPRDAPCVSAGHDTHEWTSWAAFKSVFRFFEEKYPANSSSEAGGEAASEAASEDAASDTPAKSDPTKSDL